MISKKRILTNNIQKLEFSTFFQFISFGSDLNSLPQYPEQGM